MADSKRNAKRWVQLIFSQRHDLFAAEVHFKNHAITILTANRQSIKGYLLSTAKKAK